MFDDDQTGLFRMQAPGERAQEKIVVGDVSRIRERPSVTGFDMTSRSIRADISASRGALRDQSSEHLSRVAARPANHGSPSSARRFLIISAPFGAFSRKLARELRKGGVEVSRVILNGGDLLDWGFLNTCFFGGRREEWSNWLEDILSREAITDLIAYGDTSFYAKQGVRVARTLGLRTHILEQGYFRPDWVTLERSGVNANSDLPRSPDWFRNHPSAAQAEVLEPVGRTMPSAIVNIVAYHLAMYAVWLAFPHFRTGYQFDAIHQTIGHIVRFFAQLVRKLDSEKIYRRVMDAPGGKFLLLLQRPGDSQLWLHSDFRSLPKLINTVCKNFAANAPENAQLLIRPHPLDPGVIPYEKNIKANSEKLKISDRVHFFDYGKLHEILPYMSGVVCVNSTGGLAGVEFNVPTITLGDAIYDIDGLTHRGEIDQFWTDPQFPDPELYTAFRRVVIAETQINGAYATRKGQKIASRSIARKILS